MLSKELRDTNRQSLFGGHSYAFPSSNPDLDPFLSSLVFSSPIVEEHVGVDVSASEESKLADLSANENFAIRYTFIAFQFYIPRFEVVGILLFDHGMG